MEIQYGGAILDLPAGANQDYILGKDTYKGIPIKMLPNIVSNDKCYNQLEYADEYGPNLCTLYAGVTMHSNNANYPFTAKLRKDLCDTRVKINFDKNVGGYLVDGVKCVIDGLKDGIMYRLDKSEILTVLNKGYVVNIGMYVGVDSRVFSSDGKLTIEEIEKITNAKYGHSTCIRKGEKSYWLDSYEGYKNPNKVEIEDIEKFINSWFVYQNVYLIVPNKVLRDYYLKLLKPKNQLVGQAYYNKIESQLYPREKLLFQWCMQKLYIGKITSPELKLLKF